MQVLGELVVILLFTLIGGQLSARCKLPAVIGELAAGIIIGPAVLNWVQPGSIIKSVADLGVILLMFLAGLESDLDTLEKLWKPSFLVAALGMIVPIITAYITGICFHFSQVESIFLGITFAATSVSISVAVLQEMGRLETRAGMTILGAAVVDDLLAVVLLSVVSSLAGIGGAHPALQLGETLLVQVLFLLMLFAAAVWLVPRLMELSGRLTLPAAKTLVSMVIVLTAAWGAEQVGLSNVIGAFFAGLALNRTSAKITLAKSFTVIGYSFFVPVFFASIGLEMTVAGITDDWALFLTLFAGSVASKLVGAGAGAKLAAFSDSNSLLIGSGMVSRGEMALVVAQLGLQKHLLAPTAYSVVVGAIIMTTLVAPLLLKWAIARQHRGFN